MDSELLKHPGLQLAVLVVIAIVVVMIYMLMRTSTSAAKKEGLVDFTRSGSLADYGIKQRFGGVFSGTNQGEQSVVYNDTLKNLIPGLVPTTEGLVGGREPPVFNEIGSELDAYRSNRANQADNFVGTMAQREKFTDPRAVTDTAEEALLAASIGLRTM